MDHTSGYRYPRSATAGYLSSSNYRSISGGPTSNLQTSNYGRSATSGDYLLYKGSSSRSQSNGPHLRAFCGNNQSATAPVPQSQDSHSAYLSGSASAAYQRRYERRRKEAAALSGEGQSNYNDNDSTPVTPSGTRYRGEGRASRYSKVEGILSPTRITSPSRDTHQTQYTQNPALQRDQSPNSNQFYQRSRGVASDVRSHHSVQSPDGMSANDGVSSVPSSTVDSGYTNSSAATPDNAGGLWNQLGEGMTSPPPSSGRNPGAFLFGGKVGAPMQGFDTDSGVSHGVKGIEREAPGSGPGGGGANMQGEFEPDAEAAMNSMTSIKKELERKIGQLEAERDNVAKAGLSKYKQHLLDQRIIELDAQLKTLHLSHNALQSAAKKSEQVVEHTSQAIRMMEHDTTSFEKVKQVMSKEISVLKEALRLSKERTEKLENDVTVAESGARNVDALQDKLATAQTERDKAVMRAERLNSEVKKLTDEVNVLKKNEVEISQKMAASRDVVESRRSEMLKTKNELRAMEAANSSIKQQNEELLNKLETIETELKHSKSVGEEREVALHQSDALLKEMKKKLQDVESSAKLLDEYEDKLSRAEMAIEERETQIRNLKQQVNKKSNHFHNLTLEQEKCRKLEKEIENLSHQLSESDDMIKLLREQKTILAKSIEPGKISEPYQVQIDHLMAELSLANDKMQELERIRDKLVQEKVDMVSGAGNPVVSGLLKYKQTGAVDFHHGVYGPGGVEGGALGGHSGGACQNCGYWKGKHDQLRNINKELNEQLTQLGSQHNTLKDVVRSVTPYLEKADTETADILGELDDLRRQLAEKEGELVEAKRAVDALHDQVKYLKHQLNPDSGNEDLLGGSGTNMSLNGTVENWTTNYEDLKLKLKALKKHFQHMASLRVEETDVSRCNDSGTSLRRLFMDKNFQMDTRLRDCEVVHTEIEQMIFNINMKLSKYSTYKDQSHRLQEHTKRLNDEINQLFAANEKLERDNQSLKDNLQKRIHSAGAQVMLEKDGQLVEMKKILDLKDKEIESLRNSQNGWLTERNSLKAKTDDLQTSLRAKEKMVEEYAEKVSNQDLQIVGLRHEMKELNCQVTETKIQMSQQNLAAAGNVQHHGGAPGMISASTEFNPHSTCWVTCTDCGHVIELTGETLDLTSRVSGLKEMVKKLKKENEELSMQNENFNVQLSTSKNQLLQLTHKLNTAGERLTVYKTALVFYNQLRYSNEKLCQKLSSITGQTVSKDARRFSFSGIPGGCDELLEMDSPSKQETSTAGTVTGSTLNFQPLNKLHIKPQPPRSQSLNRLEEYKSIPYSVPNLEESPMKDVDIEAIESYCNEAQNIISQKTAASPSMGEPATKSQTYPAANKVSRPDNSSQVDPMNKTEKEQPEQSTARTSSASGVLSQALRQRISRIPSPVPGRKSPLPKPIPQKQVPPSVATSGPQQRPHPITGKDDVDGGTRSSYPNQNNINSNNNIVTNNSKHNVPVNKPNPTVGGAQPDSSPGSVKARPPSPVPALVRMRSNPSLRTSNESIDNSHSEATSSSVAPKISGKQPMVSHRQMTAGLKTASVLAKKLKNNTTTQPQKKMMGLTLDSKNDPKTASLKSLESRSEADSEEPRQKQNLMTSWDDVSVDDTNRDVSSASDLPDDDSLASHDQEESGGNTSSDSRGSASNSPNASMSALYKMSSSPQGSLAESNPGSVKSAPIIASRPNLASKPAAKQKDKLASEQANKLSVRATENVPAAITTALMRSRTPNSIQSAAQTSLNTEADDVSENSTSNNLPMGNPSRENRERRINPDGRTPAGSNVSGDGRSMRPNTVVYNPNNPTQRPSIRSQEKPDAAHVGKSAPIVGLPAKRAISVSPQQKSRSALSNSGVQGNRTPVFIPGSNSRNDPGNSQLRLRSYSAEAVGGPVGGNSSLGNPAVAMGSQSKSPSISAIQQAKRQFISDGPVTSSPKPVRSPKSMNMTASSNMSAEMMMSSTEMKEPWPLDEIDTALDKLLKEDKFLTEAEVTNAIDKELEAISIAKSHGSDKRASNTPRPGAASSASARNVNSTNRSTPVSSNSSINSRTNPQEVDRRQPPQQTATARNRAATPTSTRVPRPFSPSIARIRQVQQQVEAEDSGRGYPPAKMSTARSAPHAARRQSAAASGNTGPAEPAQTSSSRRGGNSNASSSGSNNSSSAGSRKVHYL